MEDEGCHFVCYVLKFVFEVVNRVPLPRDIEKELVWFLIHEKSIFRETIAKAIRIIVVNYMANPINLLEITSKNLQDELNGINDPETFFTFVGHYSVKAFLDYSNNIKGSPKLFLKAITKFLSRFEEHEKDEYLPSLYWGATKIVVREDNRSNKYSSLDIYVSLSKGESFLVDVVNYLLDTFHAPETMKLKHEGTPNQILLTENMKRAFHSSIQHHKRFLRYGNLELLRDYFSDRCSKSFNEKDFLEFCFWEVKYCLSETAHETIEFANINLLSALRRAKIQGKLNFDALDVAARHLCEMFNAFPN